MELLKEIIHGDDCNGPEPYLGLKQDHTQCVSRCVCHSNSNIQTHIRWIIAGALHNIQNNSRGESEQLGMLVPAHWLPQIMMKVHV